MAAMAYNQARTVGGATGGLAPPGNFKAPPAKILTM
jgi:hypothetical protein